MVTSLETPATEIEKADLLHKIQKAYGENSYAADIFRRICFELDKLKHSPLKLGDRVKMLCDVYNNGLYYTQNMEYYIVDEDDLGFFKRIPSAYEIVK